MQKNRRLHSKTVQEEKKTESEPTTNIRIKTSTHELLWKVSNADNRPISRELDFLLGERLMVLKKEGRVSE